MTADAIATAARELVARTRTAQGLPATVEDAGALRRIAVLVNAAPRKRAAS